MGASLVSEAQSLFDQRRFSDAAAVLESAERLRPDDPEVLGLIAVTYAYLGRDRRKVRSALGRLSTEYGERSVTWRAVGQVALARFKYEPAQRAARTAVHLSPRSTQNWHSLAAAYAGAGWFDEAQTCMTEATRLDPIGQYRLSAEDHLGFGQWQVGRAVNYWAMTRTHVAVVAIIGFVYMGFLGIALALLSPFLLREIRVRSIPTGFAALADLSWRTEHRLRILTAGIVSIALILWLIVLSMSR